MRVTRNISIGFSAGIIVFLSLMYRFTSATTERVFINGHPFNFECLFKKTFGIPCPGCGGSRSFVMALHGDLLQSVKMNPVGLVVMLGLVSLALMQLILVASSLGYLERPAMWVRRLWDPKILAIATYSISALALGQWIFKLISH